jgi:PadR family transcriptional regulator, regulatory protein PadR
VRQSDFLRGGLDVAIMAALGRGESYGYELLTRIREAGLDEVGDASVYGSLKRLEQADLLNSRLVPSDAGPARRYYRLSRAGSRARSDAIRDWQRLRDALDQLIDERTTP